MSTSALPISPGAFAEALKDLPLSTLHLKAAELRNSIAHLDYSNEQLKPFALGTEGGAPDPDCADAISENEIVIARMQERIALLRAEVEGRGSSWLEFQTVDEIEIEREKANGEGEREAGEERDGGERLVNGTANGGTQTATATQERSSAWTDGTFQTGRIVNGEVVMDNGVPQTNGVTTSTVNTNASAGGRLDDDALRRAMEERMRALAEEDDGGMHL